jgi:hypothetical protein
MEPWEMSQADFVGPYLESEQFTIDGRADEDYDWLWDCAADPRGLRPPVWVGDGYQVRELIDVEPEGTFALLAPGGQPCGFYMDGQAWIDPEHRGKGLSSRLILAAAEFHGGSPIVDAPCGLGFSSAGLAAHRAAHALAVREAHAAGKPVPGDVLAEYGLSSAPLPR